MTAVSDETGRERKRDACIGVLASLAAAISLLERTPRSKKAAASDKMFDQMIADYKKALDEGRAALSAAPVGDDVPALKERIRLLEWAIAAKDKQILQFSDALSAPVAQEPVAWQWRYKGPSLAVDDDGWSVWLPIEYSIESFRETFADKIERGTVEYRPLYAGTPPATPAGVGADDIARAVCDAMSNGNIQLDEAGPTLRADCFETARAILALLSRAGDQSHSTHEA